MEWYYQKSIELEQAEGKQHGLAFQHIPPPETLNLWNFVFLSDRRVI